MSSNVRTLKDLKSTENPKGFQPFDSEPSSLATTLKNMLFPNFTLRSYTFIFTALITVGYILQLLHYNILSSSRSWPCALYSLGARYSYDIVYHLHIQRLIIPILLHASLAHLIRNALPLLMLGFQLEHSIGHSYYMILLIVSGLTGNIVSGIMRPEDFGVGASTCLFGVIGGVVVQTWAEGRRDQYTIITVLILGFAIINGLMPDKDNVDAWGHLGGLVSGLLFTYSILSKSRKQQIIAIIALFLTFVTLITLLHLKKIPLCD
jgi:membrane associated rhomboid family serine protease